MDFPDVMCPRFPVTLKTVLKDHLSQCSQPLFQEVKLEQGE